VLNALKPLHIDDTAYYYYASQIAKNPLHPYAFEIFWGQVPVPAMELLAPPVLPYWWAAAIRLFGENPWVWKLWLFPLCLILTWSIKALCRRFAGGLETPLMWLTAFSPAILPGINLMLDIPALALGLCALEIFFHSVDRESAWGACAAGTLAGLAAQTKYTGVSASVAMLLYGLLRNRPRLGMLATLAAASVFVSIEGLIFVAHGRSHLLSNLAGQSAYSASRWHLARALPAFVGALTPAVSLLGLMALRSPRFLLILIATAVATGYYLLGVAPGRASMYLDRLGFWPALGWLAFGVSAAVAAKLVGEVPASETGHRRSRIGSLNGFLVLWLLLEIACYFVFSTFPAVRRVLTIVVVMSLLNGRLAARRLRASASAALLRGLLIGGIFLGALYYGVDLYQAVSYKEAVEDATRWIRQRQPDATIWYVGHWGFQFYAERAGLIPVVPGRSTLRAGDWLVVPDESITAKQDIDVDSVPVHPACSLLHWSPLGYRTSPRAYYSGDVPIRGDREPLISVCVYKVAKDFTAPSPIPTNALWSHPVSTSNCSRGLALVSPGESWKLFLDASFPTTANESTMFSVQARYPHQFRKPNPGDRRTRKRVLVVSERSDGRDGVLSRRMSRPTSVVRVTCA
jgi:hypothetical protein